MEKVTRIKYKLEGNVYRSVKKFLAGDGSLLLVTINPANSLVQIIKEGDTGEVLVEAYTAKNYTDAKLSAKDMLKKYGVVFFDEVRRKKEVKHVEEV